MKLHPLAPVLLTAIVAVTGSSGCARRAGVSGPGAICASEATLSEIKRVVFARAESVAEAPIRSAMPALARQSVAGLKTPLLESYDRDTRKTSCSATLHIHLPIGVLSPVSTPEDLSAPVRYSSQPLADGTGVHFEVSDTSGLVSGISQADITRWAQRTAPTPVAPVPGRLVVVTAGQTATAAPAAPAAAHPEPAPIAPPGAARPTVTARAPAPTPAKAASPVVPTARVAAAPLAPAPAPARRVAPLQAAPARQAASPPPRTPLPARTAAPEVARSEPAMGRAAAEPPGQDAPSATRVFIHIADPDQLREARAVGAQIRRTRLNGAPVVGVAVRLVRAVPRGAEVRCLKAADCAAARRLAAWLGGVLPDGPPAVVDMHRTYQADPSIRGGTLELWLPPGRAAE